MGGRFTLANGKQVTNVDIRDRLDSLRLEIKADINTAIAAVYSSQGRIQNQVDTLEGKFTDLALRFGIYERKTTDASKVLSSKFVALGAIGIILLTALSTAFFGWLFKTGVK